jgi:hypothetical protein
MTVATPDLFRLDLLPTSFSEAQGFEQLEDSTARIVQEERQRRLSRLVELSTDPEGLDWDTLARINIEGWGQDGDLH